MADPEQLALLKQGPGEWNEWRAANSELKPDLRAADLRRAQLGAVDLSGADMIDVDLRGADLTGAELYKTDLRRSRLGATKLPRANLTEANLRWASLQKTDLTGANLTRAVLYWSLMERTVLEGADLTGAYVYGTSVWNPKLAGATQDDMVITYHREPRVTVDSLEMAQFVYLLLNNKKIRDVIDTVTSKVVLILGRFSDERKPVLDAIRQELRRHNFAPILFDFDKPSSKDITGTVETLARMARFILVDLTDPSSVPHELATIVPFLRTTPILPLRLAGAGGYSMIEDYQKSFSWCLETYEYSNGDVLIKELEKVIKPAVEMAEKFRGR